MYTSDSIISTVSLHSRIKKKMHSPIPSNLRDLLAAPNVQEALNVDIETESDHISGPQETSVLRCSGIIRRCMTYRATYTLILCKNAFSFFEYSKSIMS